MSELFLEVSLLGRVKLVRNHPDGDAAQMTIQTEMTGGALVEVKVETTSEAATKLQPQDVVLVRGRVASLHPIVLEAHESNVVPLLGYRSAPASTHPAPAVPSPPPVRIAPPQEAAAPPPSTPEAPPKPSTTAPGVQVRPMPGLAMPRLVMPVLGMPKLTPPGGRPLAPPVPVDSQKVVPLHAKPSLASPVAERMMPKHVEVRASQDEPAPPVEGEDALQPTNSQRPSYSGPLPSKPKADEEFIGW